MVYLIQYNEVIRTCNTNGRFQICIESFGRENEEHALLE